jgi:hypothetical protein
MNFLFPAIVIFALVLPGVIARQAYRRGLWNYPLAKLGPIGEQVPSSFIYAAAIDAAWFVIVDGLHSVWPRLVPLINRRAFVNWVTNNFGKDQVDFDGAVRSVTGRPVSLILFFLALYLFAWFVGLGFHWLVRWNHLDWKIRGLRFDNDWHYILKGEVLGFRDLEYGGLNRQSGSASSPPRRAGTVITAIVDVKEASYLYLGILIDYFFDANGNLDRLLLEGVRRRRLDKDKTESNRGFGSPSYFHDRFYDVRARYFVLRMSETRTLGVDYITQDDIESARESIADESGGPTDGAADGSLETPESAPESEPQERSPDVPIDEPAYPTVGTASASGELPDSTPGSQPQERGPDVPISGGNKIESLNRCDRIGSEAR